MNILNIQFTDYASSTLTGLLSHSNLNALKFLVKTLERGMMMTLSFVQNFIHDDPRFFTIIETHKWNASGSLDVLPLR